MTKTHDQKWIADQEDATSRRTAEAIAEAQAREAKAYPARADGLTKRQRAHLKDILVTVVDTSIRSSRHGIEPDRATIRRNALRDAGDLPAHAREAFTRHVERLLDATADGDRSKADLMVGEAALSVARDAGPAYDPPAEVDETPAELAARIPRTGW